MLDISIEDLRAWFDAGWAVMWSPLAVRIYVLSAGFAVLLGSLVTAIIADRHAEGVIAEAEVIFDEKFRGRPPTAKDTIDDQLAHIKGKAPPLYQAAWESMLVSFLAGAVVPAFLLLGMTLAYPWFDPVTAHLLDELRRPMSDPAPLDAGVFVLDQTLRGGVFDLLEVFAWEVTHLDNNPDNLFFSIGVFAHHLLMEAFIFSGAWTFARSIWRIREFEARAIERQNKRVEEAARQSEAVAKKALEVSAVPAQ